MNNNGKNQDTSRSGYSIRKFNQELFSVAGGMACLIPIPLASAGIVFCTGRRPERSDLGKRMRLQAKNKG